MSDVIFRPAQRTDLASIIEMLADDPLGAKREDASHPPTQAYLNAFDAIEGDPHNELIVAELDGTVVGCLQLTFIPGISHQGSIRGQIEGVRVAASQRSQGLGQRMIEWAIERARQKNCYLVQLTSDASRTSAQDFYKRLGFIPSHVGMKLVL